MYKTIILLLIIFIPIIVFSETVLDEGFESGFLPEGWTQEYVLGTTDWMYVNGGHSGHPLSPHSGNYNALFFYDNTAGNTTRLVTAEFNLGIDQNGTLSFWHAQDDWVGCQDELHVYYKNSPEGEWDILDSYTTNVTLWTLRTIILPNPSSTYYVAFEGVGNWGYGVCIDDVHVDGDPAYNNDLAGQDITGSHIVSAGYSEVYEITVRNAGVDPQNNYTVKLKKAGDIELASLDVYETILPGDTAIHNLAWNVPSYEAPGMTYLYGEVDLDIDENIFNDRTENLEVEVFPQGVLEITVGYGTEENNRLPVSFQYKNSLTESIYLTSELNNEIGVITEITYYNSFINNLLSKPTAIWMGETMMNNLSSGWIPSTQLTQVFDGEVDYPAGQNEITINLSNPYTYTGANLIVMVHRPMDAFNYGLGDDFYVTQTLEYPDRTRYERDDVMVLDPADPPEGYMFDKHPNTTFTLFLGSLGSVEGYVYDDQGFPIQGVEVLIEETQANSYTDNQGYYFLSNIFAGTYHFTANAFGYFPQTIEQEIFENETVNVDFNLVPFNTVIVSGHVVGSDFPESGLDSAIVSLTGFSDYVVETNSEGDFEIPGVYANHDYQLEITYEGYDTYSEEIQVETDNLDLGTLILNEITIQPGNLQAVQNDLGTEVDLTWSPPGMGGGEFRYDDGVVVGQVGFGSTPANAVFGAVHPHNAVIEEIHWLLTSDYGSHSYVRIFIFGLDVYGVPDTELLLYQSGNIPNDDDEWNNYILGTSVEAPDGFFVGVNTPNLYTGIGLDDGTEPPWEFIPGTQLAIENWTTGTNDWEDIGNFGFPQNMTIRAYGIDYGEIRSNRKETFDFSNNNSFPGNETRTFESYNLYRFLQYDYINPENWTQIASAVTDTFYTDTSWSALPPATYQFAVTSVYTNEVESIPSFSSAVIKTTEAGAENNLIPETTILLQNYPNPFNPSTTISFNLTAEDVGLRSTPPGQAKVEIYNIKGQKVKTFICHPELVEGCQGIVVWDGTDENNQPVSSGIYFCKLNVNGDTKAVRKMLLFK